MRLLYSSDAVPADLEAILLELGAGDLRFGGTSFGRGECALERFLQECRDHEDPAKVPAGKVPQRVYWLLDDSDQMVGIVRVRHPLNERYLQYGGNIAYYVRPSQRGKGYGKESLRLALEQLRKLGASRALVTVHPDNPASARIVLANGGVPDGQGSDPQTGDVVDRYWIEL